MKKIMLFVCLVAVMVMSLAAVAYAGNVEGTFTAPAAIGAATIHSGYAAGGNDCKACHDVHGNSNYKLFLAASASAGCNVCHAGAIAAVEVYDGATDAHRVLVATDIPDSADETPLALSGLANQLDCLDCHNTAPHGAGSGAYGNLTSAATEEAFCINCHDNNDGRVVAGVRTNNSTHVMVLQGAAYTENGDATADHANALSTSATCRSCHTNGSSIDFPHSGNFKLLVDGSTATALDTECLLCHSAGVGVTY